MLLNIKTHQIKYIGINQSGELINKKIKHPTSLRDYAGLIDFGAQPDGYYYYYRLYSWHDHDKTLPTSAYGIYLGNTQDIEKEISSKLNVSNINKFKKVYFDHLCNYPRFKLNALTNIKRCIDPEKADSIIISKHEFNDYNVQALMSNKFINEHLILYSKKEDCYYFFDCHPDIFVCNDEYETFYDIYSKCADPNLTGLHKWAKALINSNILPSDCIEFYFGNVILLKNKDEFEFIDNIYSKYKSIIYDTDLENFISKDLPKLTADDEKTLNNMLCSKDTSTRDMGIKLLSNYNIKASSIPIGLLIYHNWFNIKSSSSLKSTGFKQILRTLNLSESDFNYHNRYQIIDILYDNSTNEEDKNMIRKYLEQDIMDIIQKDWDNKYKKYTPNLNFSFKFTID